MSKMEFISRLRQCLSELPEEEIERALEYYEDYFADSPKTEEEVIESLASPEEIAENIRNEILGKPEDKKDSPKAEAGVFTEHGFETPQDRENYQEVDKFTQMVQTSRPQQEQENQQGRNQNQQEQYQYQQNQEYQNQQYRYDDQKEKKKSKNFIFMLLLIFGCIWLVILILIVLAFVLYSFNSSSETDKQTVNHQLVTEIESEIEDVVDEASEFFEDDEEHEEDVNEEHGEDKEKKEHDYDENEHNQKENTGNENNATYETSATLSGTTEFVPNQNIQSLNIDFAAGKIKICEGTQFSVKITKNKNNIKIKSEVKNGIWKLKQEENDNIWDNLKSIIKLTNTVSITITVPKNFEAEELKIEVDAGTLTADSLTAKNIDFEVDTGSIKVNKLTASQKADIETNMGSITISSGNLHNLDLECDMGKATYTGTLTGNNKIECNMGSVNMTLKNSAQNYTFTAQASMGKLNINGKSYSGLDSEITTGTGSTKVDLTVDMGTIKLKTQE
jgi:hypothetical protein